MRIMRTDAIVINRLRKPPPTLPPASAIQRWQQPKTPKKPKTPKTTTTAPF